MAAPTAQTFVNNIDIGTLLKIYSTNGVYSNLSTASEMWKFFLKLKARDPGGRQVKYLLRKSFGAASVQSVPAGSSGDYPIGQRSGFVEGTGEYKEFAMTVNIPRNLLNKTGNDLLQYADPITEELDSKMIVAARVMSAQTQGDGSGSIGRVSAATATTVSTTGDSITVTLSTLTGDGGRSHIGWFSEDDWVKFATSAGVAHNTINNAGTTVGYWQVLTIDQDADTVVLQPYTAAGVLIDITTATLGATDPTASDYMYRYGTTPNDLTAISTTDYNALSECMVGMESLTANDGRKVNGVTHSGAITGSRRNCSGAAIDSSDFQKVLSLAKRRCGKGRYAYKNAFMFDTVYDALIESRETDRRFQTMEDAKRGTKQLGYQHGNDFVEFSTDEFVSKQRIWILPESKEVLELHGKDFETVEVNPGQKFHLTTASSGRGHSRQQNTYLEGSATILSKHPAAVACIEGFSVA